MFQDIAPHIYHNEYRPHPPRLSDKIVFCRAGEVFLREGDLSDLPSFADLADPDAPLQYLFAVDDTAFYLADPDLLPETFPSAEGWGWKPLQVFRFLQPRWIGFACITAYRLWVWYGSSRFCGHCGKPMVPHAKERAMHCPACGNLQFPTICPSVIVAVTNGDKLLLTRYAASHSSYRHYALVAGYTEIGESFEATVHREVMEETGLKVKNLRFYKSQPWPFSGALLAGFFCELDGSDVVTLEQEELSEAVWLSQDEIPVNEDHSSLTSEMIDMFRRGPHQS